VDAVVLQNITEIGDMIDHANLFDLVDGLSEIEAHQIGPN
jgi:hypothetical protein